MDSCTDTNLVSRGYAQRHKLRINRSIRITIGTAGGSTFKTDGEVWVKVLAKTISGKMRTISIRAQVADIGSKCLINTAALGRDGYIMIQGDDVNGRSGSCLIGGNDRDPAVWFLDNDNFGMPILRTEGAPTHKQSRPAGLLARLAGVLKALDVQGERRGEQGQKRGREGRGGSARGRLQSGPSGRSRSKTGGRKTGRHWGRGGEVNSRANVAVRFGDDSMSTHCLMMSRLSLQNATTQKIGDGGSTAMDLARRRAVMMGRRRQSQRGRQVVARR